MRTLAAVAIVVSAFAAVPALACGHSTQSVQLPSPSSDTAQLPHTPKPATDKPAG